MECSQKSLAEQLRALGKDAIWVTLQDLLKDAVRRDVGVAEKRRWTLDSEVAARLGQTALYCALLDKVEDFAKRLGYEGVTLRMDDEPAIDPVLVFSW